MTLIQIFVLAVAVLIFVVLSRRLQHIGVTAPLVFTLLGLTIGRAGLGLLEVDMRDVAIAHLAEITLAATLFADAMRVDTRRLRLRNSMPVRLLAIGLPLTILLGLGAALVLFPGFTVWEAALLAVILGPTDAALGGPVVSDQRLPQRVRQALNVESGLNDGLALPVLIFAATFASVTDPGPPGPGGWGTYLALQLVLGPLVGLAVGLAGSMALEHGCARGWTNTRQLRLAVLALALTSYTAAGLVGGNSFIATFVSGLVVATRSDAIREAGQSFGDSAVELFNLTIFLIFGAALVPEYLHGVTWRHTAFALLALTVLRMGPVALSLSGLGLRPSTLAYVGWFGPRGMASIIYLLIVADRYEVLAVEEIGAVMALTVLVSIIAHGLSSAPLTWAYVREIRHVANEASAEAQADGSQRQF